ncbi:Uncharacterised protein [Mycobacteroides abscessus subsp. abscessus]|nr:Uncharacterised protein [Mycobacteroides abscessus subsp. abscessus]SKF60085.1 Uncharacterised protein [Mycobacteroides abscessus subsp. abscessus]
MTVGKNDRLNSVAEPEFAQNPRYMSFHCLLSNAKPFAYLSVIKRLGKQE